MERGLRRRTVLGALVGAPFATGVVGGQERDDGFDPTRHAYGFRNWSTTNPYFEVPTDPSPPTVLDRIRETWPDAASETTGLGSLRLTGALLDVAAVQLRQAIVQRAGTNGHCYGMVLTGQRYYEKPEAIPVDAQTASDIPDPTVPAEEPRAPVYDEIVNRQADQFLKFRVWVGRKAMLYRQWLDTTALLGDVQSVIDRFGTAGLTLFNDTRYSHQVLAHEFTEDEDGVSIEIYDPNDSARTYRFERRTLRFDRGTDGSLSMRPYGPYTGALFTRYDRIEMASDRSTAGPLDHLTVDGETLRETLLPLLFVCVDSPSVSLSVVGPDGEPVGRLRSVHMDRSRGDHPGLRSRYGASPGRYRVSLFGTESTDYELQARLVGPEGSRLDVTRSGSLDAGERRAFDLRVPESGGGRLSRADPGGPIARTAGTGAVGAGIGGLGYYTFRRVRHGRSGGAARDASERSRREE